MSKRTQSAPVEPDVVLLHLQDDVEGYAALTFFRDCIDAQMQLFDRVHNSSTSDQLNDNYCVEAVSDVIALLRSANVSCQVDYLASQYDDLGSWTSDDHADFERAVEARCKELLAGTDVAKQHVPEDQLPLRVVKVVSFTHEPRN